jgi:hypothetical protein
MREIQQVVVDKTGFRDAPVLDFEAENNAAIATLPVNEGRLPSTAWSNNKRTHKSRSGRHTAISLARKMGPFWKAGYAIRLLRVGLLLEGAIISRHKYHTR